MYAAKLIFQVSVTVVKLFIRSSFSSLDCQEWIGYAGTHVPMFVPRVGLMKPGQT